MAMFINDTPISLSLKRSNPLVVITLGALVYPEPPSSKINTNYLTFTY